MPYRAVTVAIKNLGNDAANNITIFVDSFTGDRSDIRGLNLFAPKQFKQDWDKVQYFGGGSGFNEPYQVERIESLRPAETEVFRALITREQELWKGYLETDRQDCLSRIQKDEDELNAKRKEDEEACIMRNQKKQLAKEEQIKRNKELFLDHLPGAVWLHDEPDEYCGYERLDSSFCGFLVGSQPESSEREVITYIRLTYTDRLGTWIVDACRLGLIKVAGETPDSETQPCYGSTELGLFLTPRKIKYDPSRMANLDFRPITHER